MRNATNAMHAGALPPAPGRLRSPHPNASYPERPPMVGVSADAITGIRGTWVVVETRPQAEKEVAHDLAFAGFDYFLPMILSEHKWKKRGKGGINKGWGRRWVWRARPDLARFVFAASDGPCAPGFRIPTDLFYFLQDHEAVYGTIDMAPAEQPAFAARLAVIHEDTLAFPLGHRPRRRQRDRCRVATGAFMGAEGFAVIDDRRSDRAMVYVETLGRTVELDLPLGDLEFF
jgi:hypothetical protein